MAQRRPRPLHPGEAGAERPRTGGSRHKDGAHSQGAFRYRDWVIAAFNRDLPYNRMIEAQIAADQLDAPDKEQLLAGLGFQALGDDTGERLDVTTRTFLGLTVGCAQCHDHKYDPIPTKDYYSLYGVFASTKGDEI